MYQIFHWFKCLNINVWSSFFFNAKNSLPLKSMFLVLFALLSSHLFAQALFRIFAQIIALACRYKRCVISIEYQVCFLWRSSDVVNIAEKQKLSENLVLCTSDSTNFDKNYLVTSLMYFFLVLSYDSISLYVSLRKPKQFLQQ